MAEVQEGLLRKAEDLQREKDAAVLAERTKAFEDQQKLQAKLQDMQRQLEKKSAHELGEGSEIDLYEQLRAAFDGDRIQRVGKGVNGADVIHEVIHNGKVCGKIVYDAKNRNAWQNEFVSKLRADKIAQAADHAILSSNKFPKDTAHVHYQDGVIVAQPARVVAIVHLLRDQIVRMHELRISKEGREQKSVELYAFITSEHCKSAARPGRDADRPHAGAGEQGAGGAPAPVGCAQEADQLRAEGAQRPGVRDRPHHRHRRQRPRGRGGGLRLSSRNARHAEGMLPA